MHSPHLTWPCLHCRVRHARSSRFVTPLFDKCLSSPPWGGMPTSRACFSSLSFPSSPLSSHIILHHSLSPLTHPPSPCNRLPAHPIWERGGNRGEKGEGDRGRRRVGGGGAEAKGGGIVRMVLLCCWACTGELGHLRCGGVYGPAEGSSLTGGLPCLPIPHSRLFCPSA